MKPIVHTCYPDYDTKSYDSKNYDESWTTLSGSPNRSASNPWLYRTSLELDGIPTWGIMSTYSGGGYVQDLGTKPERALRALSYLKNTTWIDRATRAVFVEFNLFNPNSNLFTLVSLLMEFPESGGTNPYPLINSIRLYNYVGGRAIFRLLLELTFVVFIMYYIFSEYKKFRKERREYFKSFWNVVELINIVAAVLACAFYGVHYVIARTTLNKFHDDPGGYYRRVRRTWRITFHLSFCLLILNSFSISFR